MEEILSSTHPHRTKWPPKYEFDLSTKQIRALSIGYFALLGEVHGESIASHTISSLIKRGLMLPSGTLTRLGVDVYVRASRKSDARKSTAQERAGHAERVEARSKLVAERLDAAGYPLRDGLFLAPARPTSAEEVMRLILSEIERRTVENRPDLVDMLKEARLEIEKEQSD